jgi:succinate dehydrogenase / fumarate reductase, cytochrome b subunit
MANASPSGRNRPIAPHLQIWRWGPGMLSSILHRVSGVGATVGLFLILWWLGALIAGPEAYAKFTGLVWADLSAETWEGGAGILWGVIHILLKIVVIGCSWALFAHALSGIRHFVLDTGAGYELESNKFWANASTVGGVVVTVIFWLALLLL